MPHIICVFIVYMYSLAYRLVCIYDTGNYFNMAKKFINLNYSNLCYSITQPTGKLTMKLFYKPNLFM